MNKLSITDFPWRKLRYTTHSCSTCCPFVSLYCRVRPPDEPQIPTYALDSGKEQSATLWLVREAEPYGVGCIMVMFTENSLIQLPCPDNNPKSLSKVVDANVNPMVMYHGTNQGGFSSFGSGAARDGSKVNIIEKSIKYIVNFA